jgi:hypothetical protein
VVAERLGLLVIVFDSVDAVMAERLVYLVIVFDFVYDVMADRLELLVIMLDNVAGVMAERLASVVIVLGTGDTVVVDRLELLVVVFDTVAVGMADRMPEQVIEIEGSCQMGKSPEGMKKSCLRNNQAFLAVVAVAVEVVVHTHNSHSCRSLYLSPVETFIRSFLLLIRPKLKENNLLIFMDSNMCTCGGHLRTHNSGTMCTYGKKIFTKIL